MMNPTSSVLPSRILPGWTRRLDALLAAHADRPFAWGSHDCCTFAADVVHTLTGHDFMADLRGTYTGRRHAARLLAELTATANPGGGKAGNGMPPLLAFAYARLGSPMVPGHAQRGDVVLYAQPATGRPALGVCVGAFLVGPGPTGLSRAPMALATHAWKV